MQNFLNNHERGFTRFLEMLPGIFAWTLILFPLIGGYFVPEIVAYFLLIFIAYWFYRSFRIAFFAIRGYYFIKEWRSINWRKKLEKVKGAKFEFDEIKHIIIIPNYNESEVVLSRSLTALTRQEQIDKKNLIVVLAMEVRAKGHKTRAANLIKKYKNEFGIIMATYHPDGIVGEIKGKASNETWAAKQMYEFVQKKKFNFDQLTITSCDADAMFHSRYFAALTYSFITNSERYRRIWQSPIFWYNNIERVPFPVRLVGASGHPVNLSNLQEPAKLVFNYSSYSLSFKLLHDTGYWDTDIIPEDWHLFLQTYFAHNGKVIVEPIYLPTHIDAPESPGWMETLVNRYEQCKRHAWGATDIPYAIKESIKHTEIPLLSKTLRVGKMVEGHMIWSTNWFILTLGPLIPLLINPAFARTSLGYNLPKMARFMLTVSLIALIVMIVTEIKLRPKNKRPNTVIATVKELLQWVFLPVVTLPLSVLPGLHAQTMLLFGKRLEYKVTEKI